MKTNKLQPITDDELNEMFGGPPPAKPTTTGRYRFFTQKADTCRRNIEQIDRRLMELRKQIAGHETEPNAAFFVDKIAELERDRRRTSNEMLKALFYAGQR